MAGVGFILRKLAKQDDILSSVMAYGHSTIISAGPWLITVLALGAIILLGSYLGPIQEIFLFRLILIYNFAFSFVFTGPVMMVVTRYLADCIFSKDVKSAPGTLIGSLSIIYIVQLPILVWFYFFYVELEMILRVTAIVNYLLISSMWLVTVYISAIKDFHTVTLSFVIGFFVGLLFTSFLTSVFGALGLLIAFNLGVTVIIAMIMAKIFSEYPYRFMQPYHFLTYVKKYWQLALSGLIYNIAVWVDKWIMWFSPEGVTTAGNFHVYPDYDSAMFLAYLSVLPAMAIFFLQVETKFFEKYVNFYNDILQQVTYERIVERQKAIFSTIVASSRDLIIIQGSVTLVLIFTAPQLFAFLDINFAQIAIFRYGLLGVFFQILILFTTVLLSYFDNRSAALTIYSVLLITNIVFTYVTIELGSTYYGYGYFMANLVTFVIAAIILLNYVAHLPYHAFITNNTSVQEFKRRTRE